MGNFLFSTAGQETPDFLAFEGVAVSGSEQIWPYETGTPRVVKVRLRQLPTVGVIRQASNVR